MARRRNAAATLAARVLDHLDALDRAARHGELAAYATKSLALRERLTRVIQPRDEPSTRES